MTDWTICPFRHKTLHVDKVRDEVVSPHFAFGTAVHKACEVFLKTGEMREDLALEIILRDYKEHKDRKEYSEIAEKDLDRFLQTAAEILIDVPSFFDETFPGWSPVDAEFALYEPISSSDGNFFKGFIDCLISVPSKRKKDSTTTILIDFKTCQFGWNLEKKRDRNVLDQLVLYKSFWTQKTGTLIKDVKCGFVLLKKIGGPGTRCEFFPVSVGDTSIERARKRIDCMLYSVKRGIRIKNKYSCNHCDLKDTEWCREPLKKW